MTDVKLVIELLETNLEISADRALELESMRRLPREQTKFDESHLESSYRES